MPIESLLLVRHGESTANVAAAAAERSGALRLDIDLRDADVPLSALGEQQAGALGPVLRAAGLDHVLVSSYRRAVQTARIGLDAAGVDRRIRQDVRLRDRELGVLDLLTWRGVQRLHPDEAARRQRLGKYYHRPPGGESWADVALRVGPVLEGLPDGRTLVVAHDAVITIIVGLLLELDEPELMRFAAERPVPNASLTELRPGPGGWSLERFGDDGHLRGVPTTRHGGTEDAGDPEPDAP
jgi:2,3-bisphosphoglycerate-dependent phosphoglycerate mutase